MAKKRTDKKLLPDTLYVVKDGEGEDQYYLADIDIDGILDGALVGVYELREVKVKRTKHSLENNA